MTSATLSAGGTAGFRHFQQRLGLDDCDDAATRQPVRLRAAGRAAPVPPDARPVGAGRGDYEEAVLAKIPEYVARTSGRAFVLFTSYQFMQRAARSCAAAGARTG